LFVAQTDPPSLPPSSDFGETSRYAATSLAGAGASGQRLFLQKATKETKRQNLRPLFQGKYTSFLRVLRLLLLKRFAVARRARRLASAVTLRGTTTVPIRVIALK